MFIKYFSVHRFIILYLQILVNNRGLHFDLYCVTIAEKGSDFMLQDTFATLFWFAAGALPFFIVQLLLCFKVKNSIIRKIPLFVLILGALFAADMYFNFSGIHHGWHELGAFLIAVYVFVFSAAFSYS